MSILLALIQTITFTFSSLPAGAAADDGPSIDRARIESPLFGRGPVQPCASVGCRR